METFFTVTEQTWLFLWACLIGVGLGIVYDCFRVLRIVLRHKFVAVFIEDVLFTVFYALCLFIYMTECSRGQIRFFIIIGSLLGFIVYLLTVGSLVVTIFRSIVWLIRKTLRRIYELIFAPIKKAFIIIVQKLNIKFGNIMVKLKNNLGKSKKSLKQKQSVVYNKHNNKHLKMIGSEKRNGTKRNAKKTTKKIAHFETS